MRPLSTRARTSSLMLRRCSKLPSSNVNQSGRGWLNTKKWWTKATFRTASLPVGLPVSPEKPHELEKPSEIGASFDGFLCKTALSVAADKCTSLDVLFSQYRKQAGTVLDMIVPYEEKPLPHRRADTSVASIIDCEDSIGDGIVLVVHAFLKPNGQLDKVCVCSGFVIDAQPLPNVENNGETIITCAHTLEEIYRSFGVIEKPRPKSFSFVVTSGAEVYLTEAVISSMPKSDLLALRVISRQDSQSLRLRSLPVNPYPVQLGSPILTHLFGEMNHPKVVLSSSRLPPSSRTLENLEMVQIPTKWVDEATWRRWGAGVMLGYRSYTNLEVEAGIHSSLPDILTTVLPTLGSSGGPLVCAETGAVIGMISGTRMDNHVECERGWGSSAESIFEMFSLPGLFQKGKD